MQPVHLLLACLPALVPFVHAGAIQVVKEVNSQHTYK